MFKNAEPLKSVSQTSSGRDSQGIVPLQFISGVQIKAESVCICFIDDCMDCDVPLAELTFSREYLGLPWQKMIVSSGSAQHPALVWQGLAHFSWVSWWWLWGILGLPFSLFLFDFSFDLKKIMVFVALRFWFPLFTSRNKCSLSWAESKGGSALQVLFEEYYYRLFVPFQFRKQGKTFHWLLDSSQDQETWLFFISLNFFLFFFFLQVWIFSSIWEPALKAMLILPSLEIITTVSFQVKYLGGCCFLI